MRCLATRFTPLLFIVFSLLSCEGKTNRPIDEPDTALAQPDTALAQPDTTLAQPDSALALPEVLSETCVELSDANGTVNSSSSDSNCHDPVNTGDSDDSRFDWSFQENTLQDSQLVTTYDLQLDTTALNNQALAGSEFQIDLTGAVWNSEHIPSFCTPGENTETVELTHSLSCTFPDGEQSGLVGAPTTYQFPIDHIPYESRTIKATVKFPQGDDVLGKTQWDVLLEHHNRGEVQLDNDGKLLAEITTLMSIATGESVLRLYTAGGPRFSGSNLSDGVVECVNGGHAVVLNYSSDPLATNWNYQYNECVLEGFTVSGIVTGSSTRSSSGQAFELLEIHFDSGEFVELSGTATTNVRNGDGSDPETIAVLNKSASGWLVHNRPDSIETRSHNFFSSCTLQESSGHEDSMTVKDTRGRTFDVAER